MSLLLHIELQNFLNAPHKSWKCRKTWYFHSVIYLLIYNVNYTSVL